MSRYSAALLLAIFASVLASACAAPVALQSGVTEVARASESAAAAIPDGNQWVVVLTDPRSERRRLGRDGLGYAARIEYDADPALQRLANAISQSHGLAVVEQWPITSLGVHCVVVDVQGVANRSSAHAALLADPRVQAVQAINQFKTFQNGQKPAPVPAGGGAASREDPLRYLQSTLDLLRRDALPPGLDGSGVTLAVIDSAADTGHPDLPARLLQVHNVAGTRLALPEQGEAHGTAMAGVIAARPRNGVGIRGIAPGAQLHWIRACWQPQAAAPALCDSLTLSRALDQCIALAPRVLNLSLSGPADPLLERLLMQLRSRGTLVVAAHDETRAGAARFPAPATGVIYAVDGATKASTQSGTLALPGSDVLTTVLGNSFGFVDGSSVAAAHLSASLALLMQAAPTASNAQLLAALSASSRTVGAGSSVDLCAALTQLAAASRC